MRMRQQLLARIERYLRVSGLSEAQFSSRATGNAGFLRSLRKGRVTLETVERAEDYLDLHQAAANGSLEHSTETRQDARV